MNVDASLTLQATLDLLNKADILEICQYPPRLGRGAVLSLSGICSTSIVLVNIVLLIKLNESDKQFSVFYLQTLAFV